MSAGISSQPTFASFYDFYDGPEYRGDQLRMYQELATQAGKRVLELACGTGTVTLALARAGLDVTGLDISPDMLLVAKEKTAREEKEVQSRVHFIEGDMKSFQLDGEFDCVLVPSNAFGCLTAPEDRQSCLRSIREHLRPGGRLVIEERNYTPELLTRMFARCPAITAQMARVNPATGKHTMFNWATTHIDFVTQTIYARRFIDEVQDDGTVKRYLSADGGAHRTHYFSRFELHLLIEQAGLCVRDLWGGHDRQPFGPRSYNMIFVVDRRER